MPVNIVLVRATFDVDTAALSWAEAAVLATAQERSALREARRALDVVGSKLVQDGIAVLAVATGGAPADVIIDVAGRRHADLIVLTTHGHAGLERAMYGSVAAEVLRRAAVPVLVVPRAISANWSITREHRLLVLLDGSALSERVLEPAGLLAMTLQVGVLLLQCCILHLARPLHTCRGQQYLDGLRERLPTDLIFLRTRLS
jgi:nucleotide-binding universal stress UspA family protein